MCKVPAGTQSGSRLRLRGKGIRPSHGSALAGDAYVTVQIQVPRDLTPVQKNKLREPSIDPSNQSIKESSSVHQRKKSFLIVCNNPLC